MPLSFIYYFCNIFLMRVIIKVEERDIYKKAYLDAYVLTCRNLAVLNNLSKTRQR